MGLMIVFVAVVVVGVFLMLRWLAKRRPNTFGPSPLSELEPEERKEVRRAIRRGLDVRPGLRDVAVREVRRTSRLGPLAWCYLVLAVLELGNAIYLQDGPGRGFGFFACACFLLAGGWFGVLVARARRAERRLR